MIHSKAPPSKSKPNEPVQDNTQSNLNEQEFERWFRTNHPKYDLKEEDEFSERDNKLKGGLHGVGDGVSNPNRPNSDEPGREVDFRIRELQPFFNISWGPEPEFRMPELIIKDTFDVEIQHGDIPGFIDKRVTTDSSTFDSIVRQNNIVKSIKYNKRKIPFFR